jgi:hypothetical protein
MIPFKWALPAQGAESFCLLADRRDDLLSYKLGDTVISPFVVSIDF